MDLSNLMMALAANPGSILAWEVDQVGRVALSVFQTDGGTRQLAQLVVEEDEVPAVTANLASKALVTGSYGRRTGIVWQEAAGTFSVWGPGGLLFRSNGEDLDFAGTHHRRSTSLEVIAFIDEDLARRGVKVVSGESEHAVATHLELRASVDPSYGPLDALDDCGWTVYLGRDLATFLGMPFIDRTS